MAIPTRSTRLLISLAIAAGFSLIGGCPTDTTGDPNQAADANDPGNGGADTNTPIELFNNGNIYAVNNGPTQPTVFTLAKAHRITLVENYHWNNGLGTANAGTIALRAAGGTVYGPWATTGVAGQGGVVNAYWRATPDALLPAGTYTVVDSEPATWSCNAESENRGMTRVEGIPQNGTDTTAAQQAAQALNDFNIAAADFGQKHIEFVSLTQEWEGKAITEGNLDDVLDLWNRYVASTNAWVAAGEQVNAYADQVDAAAQKRRDDAQGMSVPGAPVGPPLGLIHGVGKDVGDAHREVQGAMQRHPNYQTDGAQAQALQAELNDIRTRYSTSSFRRAISAISGVAGGAVAGGTAYVLVTTGVVVVSAPVSIVVGGAALIGGGIASAVTWWWSAPSSSCGSGNQKDFHREDGSVCSFAAGQTKVGQAFAGVMPEPGGTFTISIPGYLPVTITNFQPPAAGNQLTIDFPAVPVTAETVGQTITVDFSEVAATGTSVEDVVSIHAVPSPLDPAPNEGVTVTVTVFPAVSGAPVIYSVSGTDGYYDSGMADTDAAGQITFGVPGGEAGVYDAITVEVGELSYSVTYTF